MIEHARQVSAAPNVEFSAGSEDLRGLSSRFDVISAGAPRSTCNV
jgi:hypothetical protein